MTHVHVTEECLQTDRSLTDRSLTDRPLTDRSQVERSHSETQKFLSSMAHINHSTMAMEAAKQMRRSKQKRKTGRVVCHHLRMMLAAECVSESSPLASKYGKTLVSGRVFPHSNRKHLVEDKQISLL